MLIPIRCFGCGKPLAQLWEEYKKRLSSGEEASKLLDELGIDRYCCRACFMGQADMLPEISKFKRA